MKRPSRRKRDVILIVKRWDKFQSAKTQQEIQKECDRLTSVPSQFRIAVL
ncbi:hypothetical protein [Calothrix sp. NIES-2098]